MEDINKINEILTLISQAPDSQLDSQIVDNIKELIGKPINEIKTGVMKAIDYCVAFGLASDFALNLLLIVFEKHLDGKQHEFNNENCPWRKEIIDSL